MRLTLATIPAAVGTLDGSAMRVIDSQATSCDVAQDAVLRVSGRGRTPIWSSDAVTR